MAEHRGTLITGGTSLLASPLFLKFEWVATLVGLPGDIETWASFMPDIGFILAVSGALAVMWGLGVGDWLGERFGISGARTNRPYDMTAQDAFRYLIVYSRWASGKPDSDETGSVGSSLLEQASDLLCDAACNEQIRVWGRPSRGSMLRETRILIPADYWQRAGFNLISCWGDPTENPSTWVKRAGGDEVYDDLALSASEVRRVWPAASRYAQKRDPFLKERDNDKFEKAERNGTKWRVDGISA